MPADSYTSLTPLCFLARAADVFSIDGLGCGGGDRADYGLGLRLGLSGLHARCGQGRGGRLDGGTGHDERHDVAQPDRSGNIRNCERDTDEGDEADRHQRDQHACEAQQPLAVAAVVDEDRCFACPGNLGLGAGARTAPGTRTVTPSAGGPCVDAA
jgi:hypothetical protein